MRHSFSKGRIDHVPFVVELIKKIPIARYLQSFSFLFLVTGKVIGELHLINDGHSFCFRGFLFCL